MFTGGILTKPNEVCDCPPNLRNHPCKCKPSRKDCPNFHCLPPGIVTRSDEICPASPKTCK
jgi:hypothetical protein